jgi:NADPH:quinone reductase
MERTMKSVFVSGNPLKTEIRDVGIPAPGPNEVLVKVVCCGSNPKDWKMPEQLEKGQVLNQGQDMSGVVESVGENVYEFRRGDRIAAAHPLLTPYGTYAEYSTAPADTCFLIPPNITFEGKLFCY